MRVAEVIGGAALLGTGVLIGLAIVDDGEPDRLASPPEVTVAAPDPETSEPSGSTLPPVTDASVIGTSTPESTPSTGPAPSTDAAATTTARPTTTVARTTTTQASPTTTARPTTTVARTTTTRPAATTTTIDRRQVRVRVLNAGRPPGSAQELTDQLTEAGFGTLAPTDAVVGAGWLVVFHAPDAREAAIAVNEVVETDPVLILEGSEEDPNWAAHADEVDVLVILGGG